MIYHRQYQAENYPLQDFKIESIPDQILRSIMELSVGTGALIRGGLCYYLHTHDESYLLKDIDMIGLVSIQEQALNILHKSSKEIYINHNHAMKTVITAFWPNDNKFFKLDLLLLEENPGCIEIRRGDKNMMCAPLDYILFDRLSKIAERDIRAHSIQKTLNHYKVVNKITDHMLQSGLFQLKTSKDLFCDLIHRAKAQLIPIIGYDEAEVFEKHLNLLHEGCEAK